MSTVGRQDIPLDSAATDIQVSRELPDWLRAHRASLALTSYQTGQLFLVGLLPDGSVSVNQQNYARAMGLCADGARLWLGSLFQLWRLENMLRPGEIGNGAFDRVFVPRTGHTTGDVDIHEIGMGADGVPVFISSKYSCIATLDEVHSFRPVWMPPFVSRLVGEDRCHLNGLAMGDGVPRYVSAVSRSDMISGWRDRRHEGGVIVEVGNGRIVTDQLSMPHSPRLADGMLYALESGRGQLIRIDPQSGASEDIAFCPGFMRGLALHDGHAIVTVSKPRDGMFKGLALQDEITRRDGEPWCGVLVINLGSGSIVAWLRLEGAVAELFDVAILHRVVCPMSLGVGTIEIENSITLGPWCEAASGEGRGAPA